MVDQIINLNDRNERIQIIDEVTKDSFSFTQVHASYLYFVIKSTTWISQIENSSDEYLEVLLINQNWKPTNNITKRMSNGKI